MEVIFIAAIMFAPLPDPATAAASTLRKRVLDDECKTPYAAPQTHQSSNPSLFQGSSSQARELLTEVARGYLELSEQACHRARDENLVLKVPAETSVFAAAMDDSISAYNETGKQEKLQTQSFKGHPLGKRPDALMKAVIVRFSQLLDRNALDVQAEVKAMQTNDRAIAESNLNVIHAASRSIQTGLSNIRATRCFRVRCKDEHGILWDKFIQSLRAFRRP